MSLISLLVSLDKEAEGKKATAIGLLSLCRTSMFIATLMQMSNVLSHVNKLCLTFQRETIDFSNVKCHIELCTESVKKSKSNLRSAMRLTNALITSLQEEHDILISGIPEEIKKRFKDEVQDKYCDTFVEHFERRLPDIPLIKTFQLFDPQQMSHSEHDNYGNDFFI